MQTAAPTSAAPTSGSSPSSTPGRQGGDALPDERGSPQRASGPRVVLHLEGLAIFIAAAAAYFALGHGWGTFALLFLAPDLCMVGYLAGLRVGAAAYNAGHNYIAPVALLGAGHFASAPLTIGVALIWIAHIGFDRALGFGLKYGTAFRDTHLGRV